jgi:hypothetical protein
MAGGKVIAAPAPVWRVQLRWPYGQDRRLPIADLGDCPRIVVAQGDANLEKLTVCGPVALNQADKK